MRTGPLSSLFPFSTLFRSFRVDHIGCAGFALWSFGPGFTLLAFRSLWSFGPGFTLIAFRSLWSFGSWFTRCSWFTRKSRFTLLSYGSGWPFRPCYSFATGCPQRYDRRYSEDAYTTDSLFPTGF